MTVTHVRVVSDSHLSHRTPEAISNWRAVVGDLTADPPDLLVHTGDVTVDGAARDDDLRMARDELARMPDGLQVAVIPGNHDVGDNPHDGNRRAANREGCVSADRLVAYREALGPDRWMIDVPGWRLVGLNCLLFGSGLDAEAEQWRWLSSVMRRDTDADAAHDRIGLFVHKPLVPPAGQNDTSPGRYIPAAAQRPLLQALAGRAKLSLVVSGHAHQFSRHVHHGVLHVWVPSTWAIIPDRFQTRLALKVCGVVDLSLPAEGEPGAELRKPAGMTQRAVVDDLPDPYAKRS